MDDGTSAALALIDDRLDGLRALMTDEPVDVVTPRYFAWKAATSAALEGVVLESWRRRFEQAQGQADPVAGRRPTPPVYMHAAASRAFLTEMQWELEKDPAAVLSRSPSEPVSAQRLGILRILSLLERRLPGAFRGMPQNERDLHDGFEALLAGSGLAYERAVDPDFKFPELQTALDLKLCDGPARAKTLVADIDRDLAAYQSTDPQIIIAIYDLGFIDADQVHESFKARDGVVVRVLRHQEAR